MLILKEEDLKKVLSMGEVIEAIEQAFIELAKGSAHAPLRTIISISKHSGTMLYMPCYLEECEALSVKIVSVFEKIQTWDFPLSLLW